MQPRILTRAEHGLSRKNIDADALRVLYRLKNSGFKAYLVGGGVRDLLLGRTPKDFDIGTDAIPQQVRRLFRNCFIIGRRFRLCHVRFGDHVVEVATFRQKTAPEEGDTMVRRDNTWGTPEEDAFRRDFTINALFYDLASFSIIDYTGGIDDLEARVVRVIGDPDERFREDPVRMMRAVAIAARLDFEIDPVASASIRAHRGDIVKSSPVRVLDEIYKILRQGKSRRTFERLFESGLLAYLFPEAHEALQQGDTRLLLALDRLDSYRARGGAPQALTNPILIAHLLGPLQISSRRAMELAKAPRAQAPVDEGSEWIETTPREEAPVEDVASEIEELGEPVVDASPVDEVRSLSLPFARRDLEKLQLLVTIGSRLLHPSMSPRDQRLATKPFFPEALLLAELDGLDAGVAEEWRALALRAAEHRAESGTPASDQPGRDVRREGPRRGGFTGRRRRRPAPSKPQ